MLEIPKNILGQRVIEVIGHGERSGSKTEWPRTPDVLDRPNLSDWAISVGDDQRFPFGDPLEYAARVPLYIFNTDIHATVECSKPSIGAVGVHKVFTPPHPFFLGGIGFP
ncbi:MAG TPA: hypothetical protein VE974_15980 [Thermoanaerobaculia bacterium]|nr:hypothetical protein [Thermoanaerobaculia bacterium]